MQDPTRAAGLLDGPGRARLAGPAAAADPIRMAHLDVALRPSPGRRRGNVFGIDQDVFVNVPSDVAALAPPGGMVVHAARYLRAGEETGDWRPWLEDVLEVALPGWRDDVVDARYVPRSMVAGDAPRPETGGGRGRPGVDVAGVAGLAVAGDWVRADGYLYDAAVASGEAAARALPRPSDAEPPREAPVRSEGVRAAPAVDDGAAAFEAARPKLMAIAYRMLGSVAEAEDVVGDVAERWAAADRDAVAVARGVDGDGHVARGRSTCSARAGCAGRSTRACGCPSPWPPPTTRPTWPSVTSRSRWDSSSCSNG